MSKGKKIANKSSPPPNIPEYQGFYQGDILIDEDGRLYRVKEYVYSKYDKAWRISLDYYHKNSEGETQHYSTVEPYFFKKYIKLHKTPEELEAETINSLANIEQVLEEDEKTSDSRELAPTLGKATLIAMEGALQEKMQKYEIMRRMIEAKKDILCHYVRNMMEKIEKVQKVIQILELYLGVQEEILLVRDGEPASIDTPISFRQMQLYMDEEVGDPKNQGIDFKNIEDFDKWLTLPGNLDRVLPEKKGVVSFLIRRHDKWYGEDWFSNALMNAENKRVFILIRNGEKIFRIWSENLNKGGRLFPKTDEFKKWEEKGEKLWGFDERDYDEAKNAFFGKGMMLQGLIDRSDVFNPKPNGLNIFKGGDMIRYIRDDEASLPSNRKSFQEWKDEINSHIKRGSRIVFIQPLHWGWEKHGEEEWRWHVSYQFKRTAPCPCEGVYTAERHCPFDKMTAENKDEVEKYKVRYDSEVFKFKFTYHPKDEIGWSGWNYDPHERKNGISFYFNPGDKFILNYDRIKIEDIDFYINSRVNREDYLNMMPLLWKLKRERTKEIEWEKHFVRLVKDRTGADEEIVWKSVNWWKHKNIWQRPILKDDAKALRMIERKVKDAVLKGYR